MATLKYKIIKTKKQYKEYCDTLELLLASHSKSKSVGEEIELLTYLIEKWDSEHNVYNDEDPIAILKYLMAEHNLKSKDMVNILSVSKGLVSDILNYKKGLSKEIIRTLSTYFKVSQELFNRPYKLTSPINTHLKNASVMNTTKKLAKAG